MFNAYVVSHVIRCNIEFCLYGHGYICKSRSHHVIYDWALLSMPHDLMVCDDLVLIKFCPWFNMVLGWLNELSWLRVDSAARLWVGTIILSLPYSWKVRSCGLIEFRKISFTLGIIIGANFSPVGYFPCFFPKKHSPFCIFWSLVSPNFDGVKFFTLKITKLLYKRYKILRN